MKWSYGAGVIGVVAVVVVMVIVGGSGSWRRVKIGARGLRASLQDAK
jgi:hypothetical protein